MTKQISSQPKDLFQQKVAIVLPVYNMADFLPECLDSLLNQTHSNFTIFAVDDCSTDNSLSVLKKYKENDPRIVIIQKKVNEGVSEARNTALRIIEESNLYSYVSFCDSDDIVAPSMLEELLLAAKNEQAQIAGCCFSRLNYKDKSSDKFENYCSFGPETFIEQIFSLGRWENIRGRGGYSCIRLFKFSLICGIRFQKNKNINEDEIFCVEAATRASKITYIPRSLYFYRYRPESLSRSKPFSRQLLQARIACLPLTKNVSCYASVLNACAIARKLKNNGDLLDRETTKRLAPLLKIGKTLKLITTKEYARFLFFSILKS